MRGEAEVREGCDESAVGRPAFQANVLLPPERAHDDVVATGKEASVDAVGVPGRQVRGHGGLGAVDQVDHPQRAVEGQDALPVGLTVEDLAAVPPRHGVEGVLRVDEEQRLRGLRVHVLGRRGLAHQQPSRPARIAR